MLELGRGDLDAAEEHVHAALAAKWRLGDTLGSALAVDQLAAVAAARGDGERSARLLGAGQRIWSAFGAPGGPGRSAPPAAPPSTGCAA